MCSLLPRRLYVACCLALIVPVIAWAISSWFEREAVYWHFHFWKTKPNNILSDGTDLSSFPWEPTVQVFRNIPEETYRGKEKMKLPLQLPLAEEQRNETTSFPKGSRVGCFYKDSAKDNQVHWRGGMLGAVVHDSATFEDNLEHILVTFLEDGLTAWLPSDYCSFHAKKSVWEAGPLLYNIWYDSIREDRPYSEFHQAFHSLSIDFPDASPALFTYWQGKIVVQDETILQLEKKRHESSRQKTEYIVVDPRLTDYIQKEQPSIPVYHALSRKYTIPIDDKYYLYQLYQANELAASVFPPTFGSIREALEANNDDNDIFFLKDRGGSQGAGIRVLPRRELANQVELTPSSAPSFVIQRAVPDIFTIDGPLMGRRFDIRYHFVVFRGKVYMHSNMYAMWASAEKPFDPKDPTTENHVPKLVNYKSDTAHNSFRDYLFFPTNWQEVAQGVPSPLIGPISWRKEIAISLSKARSTLLPLLNATMSDPYSYQLVGGDAIIQRSGRAVLMEFNDWPDYTGFTARREPCLKGQQCLMRIVMQDPDGSYVVSPPTKEFYAVFSGYTAQFLRDTAALVIGLEQPESLERFREIKEWNDPAEDTCNAS